MGFKASGNTSNQSGSQQMELDAETKAFRDKLFNQWGTLTDGVFAGTDSFIPDQSQNTQDYYKRAGAITPLGVNQGTSQAVYDELARGQWGQLSGIGHDGLSYGANTYDSTDYNATDYDGTGYDAQTYATVGYDAANVREDVGSYQPQLYQPTGYFDVNAVQGYTPETYTAAQTDRLDPTRVATAAENVSPYQGLIDENLINPALAGFDRQAARGLTGLRAGRDSGTAFGDRARNADAVYQADADLNRAQLDAQLRTTGLDKAFQYGSSDADRKAQATMQDAALEASRREGNAGRTQQADADRAAALTDASRYKADATTAAYLYNYNTTNEAQRLGAEALTASNAANAAARQAAASQNAQAATAAAAYGADARNTAAGANAAAVNAARAYGADARNTSAAANAAARNMSAAANAAARNAATAQNAGARNAAGQFNAQQELARQQANTAIQQQNVATRLSGAQGLQGLDQQTFQNTLAALAAQGQAGSEQDAFNQMKEREQLDLLGMASSILSGVPYGSTTTTQQKSRGKSGSLGT